MCPVLDARVTVRFVTALVGVMAFITDTPLHAGRLRGRALWDEHLQTFAAVLDVFDGCHVAAGPSTRPAQPADPAHPAYPPPSVRIGTRCAEFATVDALVNHLVAIGLAPSGDDLGPLYRLGQLVADALGEPELVGLTDHTGSGRLYLVTPDRTVLGVNPRFAHADHQPTWGHTGRGTIETARLICEAAFLRRPGQDAEAFALALTYEFLATADRDFSLSAVSLADWFLTDSPLSTALGRRERNQLRVRVGLDRRPVRASVER